jgi:hypothetical protein
MRFIKNKEPKPNLGDERRQTSFALLPRRIDDTTTVWLERYVIVFKYKERFSRFHEYRVRGEAWAFDHLELYNKKINLAFNKN